MTEKENFDIERYKKIKDVQQEVVDNLSDSEKQDRGLIRKEVSEAMMLHDALLSPEGQEPIIERALARYVEFSHISSDPNLHGCIDSPHGTIPNEGEILNAVLVDFPESDIHRILELIADIDNRFEEIRARYPKRKIAQIREEIAKEIQTKADNGEMVHPTETEILIKIAQINPDDFFEANTHVIARRAADLNDISCIIIKPSRLTVDPNRKAEERAVRKGVQSKEYSLNVQQVINYLMRKFIRETEAPFLELNIHGKVNPKEGKKRDIVIGNGMKDSQLPCEPEVAYWMEKKLKSALEDRGLSRKDGQQFTPIVAFEGQALNGDISNTLRRVGNKYHPGFGKNFQSVQIEFSKELRIKNPNELSDILAQIIKDFSQEFPTQEALNIYIQKNRTDKDKERAQGNLVMDEIGISEDIKEGKIAFNTTFRAALGIEIGDEVEANGQKFRVISCPKELVKARNVFVSPQSGLSGQVIIKKI